MCVCVCVCVSPVCVMEVGGTCCLYLPGSIASNVKTGERASNNEMKGSIYAGDFTVTVICLASIWYHYTCVRVCTRYSSSTVNSSGVQ